MSALPTVQDLAKLPLHAIVAYAVRSARRVQPLYRRAEREEVDTVASAIEIAESFCLGVGVALRGEADAARSAAAAFVASTAADTYAASAAAYADARSTPSAASAAAVKAADAAAASAAYAASAYAAFAYARAAARAAGNDAYDDDDDAAAYAYADAGDAAAYAVDAAAAATAAARHTAGGATDTATTPAAIQDYANLVSQGLGRFPDLGLPIDPSEKGPLGALWLESCPAWFSCSGGR